MSKAAAETPTHTVNRAGLLTRKADLYAALRLLEHDRDSGSISDDAYSAARHRYEEEAAEVLQRLDELPHPADRLAPRRPRLGGRLLVAGAVGLIAIAVVIFLVAATRSSPRTATSTTGSPGTPTAVRLAERQALAHPRSLAALIGLGTAYLNAGQTRAAEQTYLAAIRIAPTDPVPATLHAMALASLGSDPNALQTLHSVERMHPRYSRAWLLDGFLSAHHRKSYRHAVTAWKRFLSISPHSSLAPSVRALVLRTERALR